MPYSYTPRSVDRASQDHTSCHTSVQASWSDVYYREESVFGNSRFLPSFGTASYRSRMNDPTFGRACCIGKRKDNGVSPLSRLGGKTGRG